MQFKATVAIVLAFVPLFSNAFTFAPLFSSAATNTNTSSSATEMPMMSSKKIAVTGATGRTGSLVVEELLDRGMNVIALVRDLDKAESTLTTSSSLKVIKCNLGSEVDVVSAIRENECDAAIWCATGFSDNPSQTFLDKILGFLSVAVTPKQSIDAIGVAALAKAFQEVDDIANEAKGSINSEGTGTNPKVIMLSSAGVTRPSWTDEKKAKFEGCADIPIVRLNPFGILDIKADSEECLRQSNVPYTIFRPTGLNDQWPSESRPIFSQGDVAVGRINRKDVAKILVDCLSTPESEGKTYEAFSLQGYQPASSIAGALGKLKRDSEGPISAEVLDATYSSMQQLLPGETQDAASLAMGQTYEELDEGKTGRLGERGTEDAEAAAPKPSS